MCVFYQLPPDGNNCMISSHFENLIGELSTDTDANNDNDDNDKS